MVGGESKRTENADKHNSTTRYYHWSLWTCMREPRNGSNKLCLEFSSPVMEYRNAAERVHGLVNENSLIGGDKDRVCDNARSIFSNKTVGFRRRTLAR